MSLREVFNSIGTQYNALNVEYSRKLDKAIAKGAKSYKKWQQKKEMNDAIHFLFVFTRFEAHIREKSRKLVVKKSTSQEYARKSGWLILKEYMGEDETRSRLDFMKRIQLFIAKGRAEYATVKDYYDTRNSLAHGGPFNIPIDVIKAKNELLNISRFIK